MFSNELIYCDSRIYEIMFSDIRQFIGMYNDFPCGFAYCCNEALKDLAWNFEEIQQIYCFLWSVVLMTLRWMTGTCYALHSRITKNERHFAWSKLLLTANYNTIMCFPSVMTKPRRPMKCDEDSIVSWSIIRHSICRITQVISITRIVKSSWDRYADPQLGLACYFKFEEAGLKVNQPTVKFR